MEHILNQLRSQVNDEDLNQISQKVGVNKDDARNGLESVVPALLGALATNTSSPQGVEDLDHALTRDHDGSVLKNIHAYFKKPDTKKGEGIVNHVLGPTRPEVEGYISQKSGLKPKEIHNLFDIAAPVVLGFIGKEKKEKGLRPNETRRLVQQIAQESCQDSKIDFKEVKQLISERSPVNTPRNNALKLLGGLFKRAA
ncbi:DUF937 domain-containing protein [Xanthovirga aplysinae]|uniref:DUF937 domain-containing protein n=1 Tax=Xanthovirga aplysinae TaxID=2529853 RepID=UPI0012BB80CD|nr:DUF937 domain-containing protein [Xanthovirga aplysinae]MTI31716.1 DUF937 domain-containing protein [Xanthovirga aplysinae]